MAKSKDINFEHEDKMLKELEKKMKEIQEKKAEILKKKDEKEEKMRSNILKEMNLSVSQLTNLQNALKQDVKFKEMFDSVINMTKKELKSDPIIKEPIAQNE